MSGMIPTSPMPPQQAPGTLMMPPAIPMMPNPAHQQWLVAKQQYDAMKQANDLKQQQFDAAVALLRKDGIHGFRLDIESDSTIAADEQAEKQSRIEFLQQMIPMLEQIIPMAQGNPPLALLAKNVALFAVRGFRVGRPLEDDFEKAFEAIAAMPPNPKFTGGKDQKPGAAGPNPQVELAKTQADVHDTDMKAQTERMAIAQKQQAANMSMQMEAERAQAEELRAQAELNLKAAEFHQRGQMQQARQTALGARMAGGLI